MPRGANGFLLLLLLVTRSWRWLDAVAACTIYVPIPDDDTTKNVTPTIDHYRKGFPRDAYAATTTASALRVLTPPHNKGLHKVTTQAAAHGCAAAVNGGPFHADGSPVGVAVVDGIVLQNVTHRGSLVGVGRTQAANNHNQSWVFGAPPPRLADLDFFVTGFGWLVRDGVNVASVDDTGATRAPRTAVGVTTSGHLVFVVADGCERWYVCVWFV